MRIISFDFDPAIAEACVALRFRLYGDDPLWLPPPRSRLRRYYQPDFSFYRDPRNHHRHFVALEGDEVAGHLSAFVNAQMRDRHGPDLGLVGLFECVDDPAMGAALIEAAAAWLGREHGATRLWGPMNFDIWHEYRLRTKGHAAPPFFGEPYNPPAYHEVFRDAGFTPLETWETVDAGAGRVRSGLDTLDTRHILAKVLDAGWSVARADPHCDRDIRDMHAVETATLAGVRAFTQPALEEYRRIFQDHGDLAGTRFMTLLRSPSGTPAGLVIAYSDPADSIRAARRPGEAGITPARAIVTGGPRKAVFYFVGVLEQEKAHRSALAVALGSQALERLLEAGHETITFALLSSGSRARVFLGPAMHEVQSEHTLFERVRP